MRRETRLAVARSLLLLCFNLVICASASAQANNEKEPKPLPIVVLGLSSNTLPVQWEEMQAGGVGFSLFNNSPDKKPRKIRVGVTQLSLPGQTIPLTFDRGNTITLNPLQSERFNLVIPSDQKFKLRPGTYTAVLFVEDQDGKFTALNYPVQVSIPSVQPALAKATLVATRNILFTTCWRGSLILPLRFPSTASELPKIEPKQSIVRKESGGLATVRWSEIDQGNTLSRRAKLTVDGLPSAGRYEGEVNFGTTQDKNSTLALSVIGTDCVVWPILVIALGIFLAYEVNRYVGVLRITWTLRRQEAELGQAFRDSQAKFESATRGASSGAYTIAADLKRRRESLRAKLSVLESKWVTSLQGDPGYTSAVADLQSLESAIAQWTQFGSALRVLQDSLGQAKSELDGDNVLSRATSEPQLFLEVQQLLRGSDLSIADLSAKVQTVVDTSMLLELWRNTNQQAKATTSSLQDIRRQTLTADQTNIANQAEQHLVLAWQHLWDGDREEALKSISSTGGDLDTARGEIAQIMAGFDRAAHKYGVAAVTRGQASLLETLVVPAAVSALPASDDRRAQLLHQAIDLGNTAATFFAFVIALLSGLSLKYFGQPFGTIQDYVGLFLWAAGTKATLDIITSIVGKFSSSS